MGHKFSSSSQVCLNGYTFFYTVLRAVSTYICSLSELPEEDGERWEAFMSGQLSDINKKNTVDLVSVLLFSFWFSLLKLMLLFDNAHKSVLNIKTFFSFPPPKHSQVNTHHIHSSSDDEVDFKDSGFHQDSSLQQVSLCLDELTKAAINCNIWMLILMVLLNVNH